MSILPQFTILGNLEIIEVYVYCDQPCLFACRNQTGHIFLAVWIEETAVFNQWLYVALSEERFASIRSGKIDLRDAFLKSEQGFVFEVRITRSHSTPKFTSINFDEINLDALLKSEEGVKVFEKIRRSPNYSLDSIELIFCNRLNEDWLPMAGEFLGLSPETNPLISVPL